MVPTASAPCRARRTLFGGETFHVSLTAVLPEGAAASLQGFTVPLVGRCAFLTVRSIFGCMQPLSTLGRPRYVGHVMIRAYSHVTRYDGSELYRKPQ